MNEKILLSLKTKFAGVQENVLNRVAKKLSETVTSEDQIETAVAGVEFQQVLDMYGDSRANEAQTSSVLNYEKKHGLVNGKSLIKDKKPETQDDDDTPKWAKPFLEKLSTLEQSQAELAKAGKRMTMETRIEAKLKEKGIPLNFMKGIQLSDDTEFDTVVSQIEADFIEVKQELLNSGVVIDKPKAASGEDADLSELSGWAESKKQS